MALLDIVTSLGPSLLSGIGNLFGTKSANDANAEQNAINRQWQSGENRLNRDWQTLENSRSRDFTQGENQVARDWQEKMWNLQNEYNSPSAMMERYRDANLNPFISGQIGQGAGAAGTPASSATAPMGSPSMAGAPSSIPMQAPRFGLDFGDLGNALGVSANIANVNARTSQQKWETYAFIRNNVSRSAAKEFLNNNPDMLRVDDPENNPYMETYQRSKTREDLENSITWFKNYITSLYGVKTAEKELYKLDQEGQNLAQLILNNKATEKEIWASVAKINEQINTEKSIQSRNYSEADLASAKAQTENESRMYIIRQLLLNTNILDFVEQSDRAKFESEESLRGWLTSEDGRKTILDASRKSGIANGSWFYDILKTLANEVHVSGGVTKIVR